MRHWKLLLLLAVLLTLNITAVPDKIATEYLEDSLQTSGATYVVARGLNATISLLQDIEVGVGVVSASPGELLDPVNDLIERFASVLLIAIASLGIQKIVIGITGWLGFQLLVAVSIVVFMAYLLVRQDDSPPRTRRHVVFFRILVTLLVLRFTVPFAALVSGVIEQHFVRQQVHDHVAVLQSTNASLKEMEATQQLSGEQGEGAEQPVIDPESAPGDLLGSLRQRWELAMDSVKEAASTLNPLPGIREDIRAIDDQLEASVGSITELVGLFIFQSILLPIGMLYAVVVFMRWLFRTPLFGVGT